MSQHNGDPFDEEDPEEESEVRPHAEAARMPLLEDTLLPLEETSHRLFTEPVML